MKDNILNINTIIYAARHKDKKVLLASSSGGVFTALSDYFFAQGWGVIASVYNYQSHTEEFCLIHSRSERDSAIGSKYMQSRPGNVFREAERWLRDNPDKNLLFVGMGCQADGLRKFAEIKGFRHQVFIVDIICHGSPSAKLWREYASSLEQHYNGKIQYLTFKDKRNGWKAPTAFVVINQEEVLINDYNKVFYDCCTLRPSCYVCPYATIKRKTDMTIGDFWNIEKTIPDFYDTNGNSLILIHTNRGEELFENIKHDLNYRLSNVGECIQNNLREPTAASKSRDKFWRDYYKKGIDYVMRKYGTTSYSKRIKNKINKLFGGVLQNSNFSYADYFGKEAA